jgi:hypothetical protein
MIPEYVIDYANVCFRHPEDDEDEEEEDTPAVPRVPATAQVNGA